jgi:hypothetical protein
MTLGWRCIVDYRTKHKYLMESLFHFKKEKEKNPTECVPVCGGAAGKELLEPGGKGRWHIWSGTRQFGRGSVDLRCLLQSKAPPRGRQPWSTLLSVHRKFVVRGAPRLEQERVDTSTAGAVCLYGNALGWRLVCVSCFTPASVV